MQFYHLSYTKDALLVQIPLMAWNVPGNRYDGSALQARDQLGCLSLYVKDSYSSVSEGDERTTLSTKEPDIRSWYTSRATLGPIIFAFTALPRIVNNSTVPCARIDLRTDGGGLIGSGINFLPLPTKSETLFDLNLHWNLTAALKGTTAAWSFGDGLSASLIATSDYLANTVYAVGPLRRYLDRISMDDGTTKIYGFYWFGEPSLFNAHLLAVTLRDLFAQMAPFFEDEDNSYRIFLRYHPFQGYGGTGQYRSFVMEYDSHIQVSEDSNFQLLAHEMVHNWPLLEGWDNPTEDKGGWYTEGSY
jgi:hypothetical protein